VHWFNHNRLHSAIGDIPPIEYETEYYRHNQHAEQTTA
jgi:putative transposase